MGNLALLFIEVLYLQAKEVAGRSEGEAGTGRVIAENRDAQTAFEYTGRNIVLTHIAECVGENPDGFQFVIGLVPGEEKVVFIHILEIKGFKLIQIILQVLFHNHTLLLANAIIMDTI